MSTHSTHLKNRPPRLPSARAKARREFRLLIERALRFGGNYYLTYHRWATRGQLLRAYPQMPDFLRLKKAYDPAELFQSDWYRHHRALLARQIGDGG